MIKNTIHVVYAIKPDNFQVLIVPENASSRQIHQAIASFENDEALSNRKWSVPVKPGSFMIKRVRGANDSAHAIKVAKAKDLTYLPMPEAYKFNKRRLQVGYDFSQSTNNSRVESMVSTMVDNMWKERQKDKSFRR